MTSTSTPQHHTNGNNNSGGTADNINADFQSSLDASHHNNNNVPAAVTTARAAAAAAAAAAAGGYTSDNHLAGLVEAATAAAGQDVGWNQAQQAQQQGGYAGDIQGDDAGFGDGSGQFGGRQLRNSVGMQGMVGMGMGRRGTGKRKRGAGSAGDIGDASALDPAIMGDSGAGQQFDHVQNNGNGNDHNGDGLDIREFPPQQSLADARSAGVHSAAALFRQRPSTAKKYTRPPMSKLFASLELSPENFLYLQAEAKAYMLDEDHPERRECVGQRGRGDTEMVKLRLWNCVREFLESGNGERFFGENVVNEGMAPRQVVWPRDSQQVISLVIPLLRRMVTNERQRQYANETRRGGSSAGGNDGNKRRKTSRGQEVQQHQPPQLQQQGQEKQESNEGLELGFLDLLLEGYPTDWNTVSRAYNTYNTDMQLDSLGSISGLPHSDWLGLVGAVDSHYQVIHQGNGSACSEPCEKYDIDRIISSDTVANANWRVSGADATGIKDFATGITRDVHRIVRSNLNKSAEPVQPQPSISASDEAMKQLQSRHSNSDNDLFASSQNNPISLRINILRNGKRILPRYDLPADQCPDLVTLRQKIHQHYQHLLPGNSNNLENGNGTNSPNQNSILDTLRFKVWLADGLVPVQNDGEWMIALMSAGTVEWMDGDLRVIGEVAPDSGGRGGATAAADSAAAAAAATTTSESVE